MPENWVEELADNWLRMKGYLISRNLKFERLKEIDLFAVNDKEYCIVDCKTGVHSKGYKHEARDTSQRFNNYVRYLSLTKSPYHHFTIPPLHHRQEGQKGLCRESEGSSFHA